MPPPLVWIIVRSMGRACLGNAVASVAQQTHRPLELLVVDATGGSHPPLPPLPSLTRTRLVDAGRPLLRPAAANVGIAHAEGEWIGFLDDDDFFEPTRVERLLSRAMEPDRPRLVHAQLWGLDRLHPVATPALRPCASRRTSTSRRQARRAPASVSTRTIATSTCTSRTWCAAATGGSATRRGPRTSRVSATTTKRATRTRAPCASMPRSTRALPRTLDAFFYRTSLLFPETAGRVVAEAMATGLPCVCASNVGFAEIITHGVDGFLFHRDDDEAALAHLSALRDDAHLRQAVGRAARARAEQVFGDAFVQHIRDAYLGAAAAVSFPPQ